MVAGVHGADHAGQGLAERGGVEAFALVGEQAALGHHLCGNHDVGGVASDVLVRISGSGEHSYGAAFVGEGGLDGELVAGLEL